MYNNDDIQKMIEDVNAKGIQYRNRIVDLISDSNKSAVRSVLADGWVESFDRFDSDVCEQFILAYEKLQEGR